MEKKMEKKMETNNNENQKYKKWREGYASGFIAATKKYKPLIDAYQKAEKKKIINKNIGNKNAK